MKICDNYNDCDDQSDEEDCESKLNFQIRLAGSDNDYEGRVEVQGNYDFKMFETRNHILKKIL